MATFPWAQFALAAVGLGMARKSYKQQAEFANRAMAEGAPYRAKVEGLNEYFLGGGRASDLNIPGFREQFAEVDFSLQEEQRRVDAAAMKERQAIADNLSGGAKIRALVELARKTQDLKGKAAGQATQKKRDLDISLTNQYLSGAMGYNTGVTSGEKLQAATSAMANQGQAFSALGGVLGSYYARKDAAENRPTFVYQAAPTAVPPRAPAVSPTGLITEKSPEYDEEWLK